jgi:PadR family transcriptional regulator, regulatory protein PadR
MRVADQFRHDCSSGQLDMIIEKTASFYRYLGKGSPNVRLGITLHILRTSNDVLRVEEGSIYPALHRMEQHRWIASEWGTSENNRRARFYRLIALGRKRLKAEQENWQKSPVRSPWACDAGNA